MKLRKVIAGVAAAAVASSVLALAASAETAGIMFQTTLYTFRNNIAQENCIFWDDAWAEENMDADVDDSAYYGKDFTYNDVEITGDGTYTCSVSGIPTENLSGTKDGGFNFIKLSTNISGDKYPDIAITVDEIKVNGTALTPNGNEYEVELKDTKKTAADYNTDNSVFDNLGDEEKIAVLSIINVYNATQPFDYPADLGAPSSIEVTFTVSGMGTAAAEEAAAEETTAVEDTAAAEETVAPAEETTAVEDTAAVVDTEAAPATEDKANADTGIEGVAVIFGLAVLATAGVVVTRKHK